LTFPLPYGHRQPYGFSSFILRLTAQSFAGIVSHIDDAGDPAYECTGPTTAFRQRMLNFR
jgi:hypothetical protein